MKINKGIFLGTSGFVEIFFFIYFKQETNWRRSYVCNFVRSTKKREKREQALMVERSGDESRTRSSRLPCAVIYRHDNDRQGTCVINVQQVISSDVARAISLCRAAFPFHLQLFLSLSFNFFMCTHHQYQSTH